MNQSLLVKLFGFRAALLILFGFVDWAGLQPGDAQRFLLSLGYRLWRLRDHLAGRPPFEVVLESGGEMVVARRP